MRGPGMRLDLDVRRRWRCPKCGSERRLHGSVTAVMCQCAPDAPFMHYVETVRPHRPEPRPYDPYLDAEAVQFTDELPAEDEAPVTAPAAGRGAPVTRGGASPDESAASRDAAEQRDRKADAVPGVHEQEAASSPAEGHASAGPGVPPPSEPRPRSPQSGY